MVKEFFTKLNALARYILVTTSIDKRKIEIFINGLRLDIAKDMFTKDNLSRSYTVVVGKAYRSKARRLRMA